MKIRKLTNRELVNLEVFFTDIVRWIRIHDKLLKNIAKYVSISLSVLVLRNVIIWNIIIGMIAVSILRYMILWLLYFVIAFVDDIFDMCSDCISTKLIGKPYRNSKRIFKSWKR